jgi:hypothetical protein
MPSELDDKMLTGYLLGELSEAQQIQVEEQLFADRECYDRLQALKAEMTDQYVQGALAPRQRVVFARRFLTAETGREDELFSRVLGGVLREPAKESNPADHQRLSVAWWLPLVSFFRSASGWQTVTAVAIGAFMIGISWLLVDRNRLGQRLETAISERDIAQSGSRKAAQLEEEMERANSRIRSLDQELSQARRELEQARQNPETIGRQSGTTSAISAVLSLILAPGARRGNEKMERLTIVPGARMVQLQLLLEPGETGAGSRAEVRAKDGTLIHSQDRLRSRRTAAGTALLVMIPADRLNEGIYQVSLSGSASTGEPEIINYYDFSVARRF